MDCNPMLVIPGQAVLLWSGFRVEMLLWSIHRLTIAQQAAALAV